MGGVTGKDAKEEFLGMSSAHTSAASNLLHSSVEVGEVEPKHDSRNVQDLGALGRSLTQLKN